MTRLTTGLYFSTARRNLTRRVSGLNGITVEGDLRGSGTWSISGRGVVALLKSLGLRRPRNPTHLERVLALVIFVNMAVILPPNALAGRPLVIDDAAAVAPSHLEIELGLTQLKPRGGDRDQRWPVATATYGIGSGLEMGLGIQRVNQDLRGESPVRGFEDLHLTAKYNFLTETNYLPAMALALDVKVPTANRDKGLTTGKFDEDIVLILTKGRGPFAFHVNLGYLVVDSPANEKLKNRFHGGFAAEWAFQDRWTLVGEIVGFSREARRARNEADFQLGLRYGLSAQLTLDAAAGRSLLSSGNEVQGTFGLTWTVDFTEFRRNRP